MVVKGGPIDKIEHRTIIEAAAKNYRTNYPALFRARESGLGFESEIMRRIVSWYRLGGTKILLARVPACVPAKMYTSFGFKKTAWDLHCYQYTCNV